MPPNASTNAANSPDMGSQGPSYQIFKSQLESAGSLRHETPPKPTAVIPFNRDRDCVQRDTILDQVDRLCSEPALRVALVGLGGVGKSQIAIEYANRVRDRSPETWVFWVDASSAASYEQRFREIAEYLKLPRRRNPQSNIFQLLYDWLRGDKSGRWVLILDNVDEVEFLHIPADHDGQRDGSEGRSQPLVSYLPHCQHGSILITTRSKHAALTLAEERGIITVDPIHQVEPTALAHEHPGTLDKQRDIERQDWHNTSLASDSDLWNDQNRDASASELSEGDSFATSTAFSEGSLISSGALYSATSYSSYNNIYISELANDLFAQALEVVHDAPVSTGSPEGKRAWNRVFASLPGLLQDFALSVGYQASKQIQRDIMFFVHKHRRAIAGYFEDAYVIWARSHEAHSRESIDKSGFIFDWLATTDEEATAKLSAKAHYRSSMYHGTGDQDYDEQDELQHVEYEIEIYEPDDDEAEAKGLLDIYRDFVHDLDAYQWLRTRLRRAFLMTTADPDIMTRINQEIMGTLPRPLRVTRRASSETYKVSFYVEWDPHSFLDQQICQEEPGDTFANALTLTGSTDNAQAVSCAEYLCETWPLTGPVLLELMKITARDQSGSEHTAEFYDHTKLSICTRASRLVVEASGTRALLAELGQQLAWLGSALPVLQAQPNQSIITYCSPVLIPIHGSGTPGRQSARNLIWAIRFETRHIIRNTVLVQGFPVPRRPERVTNRASETTDERECRLTGSRPLPQYNRISGSTDLTVRDPPNASTPRAVRDEEIREAVRKADPRANDDSPQTNPPKHEDRRSLSLGFGVAIAVASYFAVNSFYVRTCLVSLVVIVLCYYLWKPRRNVTKIAKCIILIVLGLWTGSLSPLHVFFPTFLDLWTPYQANPSYEPYDIIYDRGETSYGDISVDVFAIHGLGSNPSTAWSLNDGIEIHWLRDILPARKRLRKMRVILLNHKTSWTSDSTSMTFDKHAKDMLYHIKSVNKGKNPIIFVAHSFGGLLLKQALIYAQIEGSDVALNTAGIMFLGVPHRGAPFAWVARLLACTAYWRGSSDALLNLMADQEIDLRELDSRFQKYFVQPTPRRSNCGPHIANFLEMRPDKLGGFSVRETVDHKHGELSYGEEIFLDTDHRGLNKFRSADDANFKMFLEEFLVAFDHITQD
ncbi:hypothetical protein PG984_008048 [Apiospora sp. TS-2023a]